MMTLSRRIATLVALLALAAPAAASAATNPIYLECQEGKITGKYSQKQFSDALRNIPTDVDEYTDCRDIIRRAQLGAAGGSGGGGGNGAGAVGGGTAFPSSAAANAGKTAAQILATASPAERAAVSKATGGAATRVVVGGRTVSPDTAGLSPAGAANVVPTPLIVALVLLGACLALAGSQSIRTRVLGRRTPPA